MPWRNCCSPPAVEAAQHAARLPWRFAAMIFVLAGVAGFTAILGAVRRRIVIVGVSAVLVAIAGLILAGTTLAATPSQTVGAQFRHQTIHRISVAADTPASHITTACLARPRGVFSCSAAVWDQAGVALVLVFRFSPAKGVAGYSGPSGARWKTTLPYGKRRHRHLVGFLVSCTIGQPIVGP